MVRLVHREAVQGVTESPSFNPTVVRLVQDYVEATWGVPTCFNPTVVRLVPYCAVMDCEPDQGFNPTVVRLVLAMATPISVGMARFNPTVVRLVRRYLRIRFGHVVAFQSHRGSISTRASS